MSGYAAARLQRQKGGDYEDFMGEIQTMIDNCESIAELNAELEFTAS